MWISPGETGESVHFTPPGFWWIFIGMQMRSTDELHIQYLTNKMSIYQDALSGHSSISTSSASFCTILSSSCLAWPACGALMRWMFFLTSLMSAAFSSSLPFFNLNKHGNTGQWWPLNHRSSTHSFLFIQLNTNRGLFSTQITHHQAFPIMHHSGIHHHFTKTNTKYFIIDLLCHIIMFKQPKYFNCLLHLPVLPSTHDRNKWIRHYFHIHIRSHS